MAMYNIAKKCIIIFAQKWQNYNMFIAMQTLHINAQICQWQRISYSLQNSLKLVLHFNRIVTHRSIFFVSKSLVPL
jgi:hypothetical protein